MSDATSTTEPAPEAGGETAADEAAAPSDELREGHLAVFTEALGDKVLGSHIQPGRDLWVRVERSAWVEAVELARNRLGCTFFEFLSALDWLPSPWGRYEDALIDAPESNGSDSSLPIPEEATADLATGVAGGDTRFQVICRLVDVRQHHSVILKADVADPGEPDGMRIASLVPIFAGANWHERECWEMFGITFDGHPGLRHLYLPGAFEGHPLRKDFPLLARLVKPWPGIVDVEPMPESAEPAEGATTEGDTAAGDDEADAGDEAS
jgi:NADH-quinone oxidoreductase subunit C